jgi:hypothetical protein
MRQPMINERTPYETMIVARAERQAADAVSDDGRARRFGFNSAVIPAPNVYSYMSRLPAEAWGIDWLKRGAMSIRNRRPIYDGDVVTVSASRISEDRHGLSVRIVLRSAWGEEVATGGAGLPHEAIPAPELWAFPLFPTTMRRDIRPGGLRPGDRYASDDSLVLPEGHAQTLRDFDEAWAGYGAEGVVNPASLLRRAIRDRVASYNYPTPTVFVAAQAQHFNAARVGDKLATSGVVIKAYAQRGHHYVDADQLVIANGLKPIALFHTTSIYALRQPEATRADARSADAA